MPRRGKFLRARASMRQRAPTNFIESPKTLVEWAFHRASEMQLRLHARGKTFISRAKATPRAAALCQFYPGEKFFPQWRRKAHCAVVERSENERIAQTDSRR
jgi:hypothetical protein